MVDVRAIDGHDLIAADIDRVRVIDSGRLHHSAAKVLHHNPVGVCRVQTDSEGQMSRSRYNTIMSSDVGKAHEKLLVLVYCRGVVRNRDTLSNPLDGERLPQSPVGVEFASVLRRSHLCNLTEPITVIV